MMWFDVYAAVSHLPGNGIFKDSESIGLFAYSTIKVKFGALGHRDLPRNVQRLRAGSLRDVDPELRSVPILGLLLEEVPRHNRPSEAAFP